MNKVLICADKYLNQKICLIKLVLLCIGMADTAASGHGAGSSTSTDKSGLPQENNTGTGIDLGSIYTQCSTSRSAASTISVTEIKNGSGTAVTTTPALIGSLNWEGDS
jgi:hypothetical protein